MSLQGAGLAARHAVRITSRTYGANHAWMSAMARARGLAAQAPVGGKIDFPRSRVVPARLEDLRRAREVRKVSYSLLVDELLARAIYDEQGQLVGLRPADDQQELPLKTA